MGVEQVRRAVQPYRGLPCAWCTLDADRPLEPGTDDQVLLGLDGCHDVAHGADPRPLDLGLEDLRMSLLHSGQELFVLEGRHLPVLEPEPSTQLDTHRLRLAGSVERPADPGPPVDHHRVAGLVGDVTAADVEAFALGIRVLLVVVEPAEEQGDSGICLLYTSP